MRRELLAATICLATACGSSGPASQPKKAAPAPVAPKVAVAPPAAEEPKDTFVYSPIGKRDPFRSPLDDLIIAHASAGRCPLCRWDVDQLKLVAVVTGTGSPVAMVEDPNGLGHFIRQATNVGKLGGRVTSIQRDLVVITEIVHDPFGKVVQNKTQLKIEQVQPDQNATETSLLNE